MSWFVIALMGPALYAVANHTDKYLISRYLKNGQVGSLVVFSSLYSVVALPIVVAIHPQVFDVTLARGLVLALNGVFIVVSVLCYFYALAKDEASYVVPFYQTIPVFGLVLGYWVLGETITTVQALAALVIVAGALMLSFDLGDEIRFKRGVIPLMLMSSFCYAVHGVVFKRIASNDGFWPSVFWSLVGKIGAGALLFALAPVYRRQFIGMCRGNTGAVLGLNALSESLFITGEGAMQYATLLAPVALVMLVNSFQPLFVIGMGVFLSTFAPQLGKESLTPKQLLQKIVGSATIGLGAVLIAR